MFDDGYRTWSYSCEQVRGAAYTFAARLRRERIVKGEKIIFWGENRPEWIVALWGCLSEGVPIESGDTAEIIFTSGATAEPKGVVITHRNILANIIPIEREVAKYRPLAWPFSPVRFLDLLPLSHMFGQAMAAFIPPMLSGVVVLMRGYNPREIVRQLKTRRISVLVCVPKMLDVLRDYVIQQVPNARDALERETVRRSIPRRLWHYREVHRLLGWKFWSFVVG